MFGDKLIGSPGQPCFVGPEPIGGPQVGEERDHVIVQSRAASNRIMVGPFVRCSALGCSSQNEKLAIDSIEARPPE
jgi:hypothetical protein